MVPSIALFENDLREHAPQTEIDSGGEQVSKRAFSTFKFKPLPFPSRGSVRSCGSCQYDPDDAVKSKQVSIERRSYWTEVDYGVESHVC